MDSRIRYITTLKDGISSRNSQVFVSSEKVEQLPTQQDIEYLMIRKQVIDSSFYESSSKHTKIRLKKWIDYLDKITTNHVWIRSRNKYIKLLNLMCYCQCIIEPFNALPPEGQLPTLRKHEVTKIIDQVENQVKKNGWKSNKNSRLKPDKDKQNRDRKIQQQERLDKEQNNVLRQTKSNRNHNQNQKSHFKHQKRDTNQQSIDFKDSNTRSRCSSRLSTKSNKQKSKHSQLNVKTIHQVQFPPKCSKKKTLTVETEIMPKSYWDSASISQIHTPKYLNHHQSEQVFVEEGSIQLASFRQQSCDCSKQMFGDNWLTTFINNILD